MLGTTFIKLGQILSTRADLVGPEIAEQLAKLQSGTPPGDPETVVATILADLGDHPDNLYREFDTTAIASASIGQVHKAVLHDGTGVVVKVQTAGIEERIQNDLEILLELAKVAEQYWTEAQQYRPVSCRGNQAPALAPADVAKTSEHAARLESAGGIAAGGRVGHHQPPSAW